MTRLAGRRVCALVCVAVASACERGTSAFSRACGPISTFADARTPTTIVHVSTTGSDDTGLGSAAQPFHTIGRAARQVAAGTAIYVHAGTYEGRTFLLDLHGTDAAPIWIMGAPGESRPAVRSGPEGLHFVKPRYVIVQDLEISDTNDNGINVDDGDEVANAEAARFVVFRNLDVHDTGRRPSGVANCLKLAGVNDIAVLHSRFARCGNGPGSGALGVDGVGVHRAQVSFNRFEANGYGGVQFKGNSADIEISSNTFAEVGWRGVNMGGSTGDAFFRPPPVESSANAEAARIRVMANTFVGGESAAAFAGCVDCQFVHNTVVDPSKWPLRILQEMLSHGRFTFTPASRGLIAGNIFYFKRSDVNAGEDINVGADTDSASFSLARNLWFAHDAPEESRPRLTTFKGSHSRSIVGVDPGFVDPIGGDFRLKGDSAARAAGSAEFGSGTDLAGRCYASPPSLGALQFNE